jgi:hypothetical protein
MLVSAGKPSLVFAEGGLCFTFDVLSPHFVHPSRSYAICLHRLLQRLYGLPELRIKWTNDLFWNDHKLGGIAVQHQPATKSYVIGLGLNTNNIQDPLMKEYRAISHRDILGFDVSTECCAGVYPRSVVHGGAVGNAASVFGLLQRPSVWKGQKSQRGWPQRNSGGRIRCVDSLGYCRSKIRDA